MPKISLIKFPKIPKLFKFGSFPHKKIRKTINKFMKKMNKVFDDFS